MDGDTGCEQCAFDSELDLSGDYGDFTNRGVSTWLDPPAPPGATCGRRILVAPASGHVIVNDGAGGVRAARWDPAITTPIGPETVVIENVYWALGTDRPWVNVSDHGTAVYVPGDPSNRHLVWLDRQGQITELPGETDQIDQAFVSRDGRRVVHGVKNAQRVVDLATRARTRILSDLHRWNGGWLPGDDRIAVSSNKNGDWDLHTIETGGSGELTGRCQMGLVAIDARKDEKAVKLSVTDLEAVADAEIAAMTEFVASLVRRSTKRCHRSHGIVLGFGYRMNSAMNFTVVWSMPTLISQNRIISPTPAWKQIVAVFM